jgi:hypothetical protein
MAPRLHMQIEHKESECRVIQAHADAITQLHVHGILTNKEAHKARKRLVKEIEKQFSK